MMYGRHANATTRARRRSRPLRRNQYVFAAIPVLVATFTEQPARASCSGCSRSLLIAATPRSGSEWAAGAHQVPLDEAHLVERLGLLTIIVMGEAFVKVSLVVSDGHLDGIDVTVLVALFVACSRSGVVLRRHSRRRHPRRHERIDRMAARPPRVPAVPHRGRDRIREVAAVREHSSFDGERSLLGAAPFVGFPCSLTVIGVCTRRVPQGPLARAAPRHGRGRCSRSGISELASARASISRPPPSHSPPSHWSMRAQPRCCNAELRLCLRIQHLYDDGIHARVALVQDDIARRQHPCVHRGIRVTAATPRRRGSGWCGARGRCRSSGSRARRGAGCVSSVPSTRVGAETERQLVGAGVGPPLRGRERLVGVAGDEPAARSRSCTSRIASSTSGISSGQLGHPVGVRERVVVAEDVALQVGDAAAKPCLARPGRARLRARTPRSVTITLSLTYAPIGSAFTISFLYACDDGPISSSALHREAEHAETLLRRHRVARGVARGVPHRGVRACRTAWAGSCAAATTRTCPGSPRTRPAATSSGTRRSRLPRSRVCPRGLPCRGGTRGSRDSPRRGRCRTRSGGCVTWSSIATRSATFAGWFTCGSGLKMPEPMWMRSVACAR